jgi:hypothetical protein
MVSGWIWLYFVVTAGLTVIIQASWWLKSQHQEKIVEPEAAVFLQDQIETRDDSYRCLTLGAKRYESYIFSLSIRIPSSIAWFIADVNGFYHSFDCQKRPGLFSIRAASDEG